MELVNGICEIHKVECKDKYILINTKGIDGMPSSRRVKVGNTCPKCAIEAEENERLLKKHEEIASKEYASRIATRLYDRCNLPDRIKEDIEQIMSTGHTYPADLAKYAPAKMWLFISGDFGVGKTVFAGRVMRNASQRLLSSFYINGRDINAVTRNSFKYREFLENFTSSVVVIDEVSRVNDNSILEDIISKCYDSKSRVILVSNETMPDFLKSTNHYIVSRCKGEKLTEIVLNGDDKRV